MPTSPATPRSDSPVLPSFPRRLLSATTTPTLPRIAEKPQVQTPLRPSCQPHAQTFLYSPSIPSPRQAPGAQGGNYNFLDSSSSSSSRSSSSSKSTSLSSTSASALPHETYPSCLSLQNLGFQDEFDNENHNCDDWNGGWEISIPPAKSTEKVVKMKRNSGPYGRVPTPEIPLIKEGEFGYYPHSTAKTGGGRQDDRDDGSLKLARRRITKRSDGGESGFGKWLRQAWGRMRFGARH